MTTREGSAGSGVLVVGSSGKVGRRVVEGLRAKGEQVRPAGRSVSGPGTVIFDWERPETWQEALAGIDRAFLIRPQAVADSQAAVGELLAAAQGSALRHVVLMTAYGTELDETSVFRQEEKMVEVSGFDWTFLRPNWFWQNFSEGDLFLPSIMTRDEIKAPAAEGAVSFVDTGDIAAVAVAAMTEPGHTGRAYSLTGPTAVTFADVAEAIGEACGRTVRYVDQDPTESLSELVAMGVPATFAELSRHLYDTVRAGYAAGVEPAVEQVTGRPARDLKAFARQAANAWRRPVEGA